MKSEKLAGLFLLTGVPALFVTLYWRCLFIAPASDDWVLIYPVHELVRHSGWWGAIVGVFKSTIWLFYRPIAMLPMMLATDLFGWVQAAKLGLMVLLYILVARVSKWAGLPSVSCALVGAATILHQVFGSVVCDIALAADVVLSIGFVLEVGLCIMYCSGRTSTTRFVVWTSMATAVCLFTKEAGVVCFMLPLLFIVIRPLKQTAPIRRGLLIASFSMFLLTVAYLAIRGRLGLRLGGAHDGYYSLSFGFNVVKNLGLAIVGLFSPVETTRVALDGGIWKGLAALWSIGLAVTALLGFVKCLKTESWRLPLLFFVACLLVQGPVLLMPHLTEANFARSIALGSTGFALCLRPLLQDRVSVRKSLIVYALCVSWLFFDISAVSSKCADMVTGQSRAARYRAQIKNMMPTPDDQRLRIAVMDPKYQGYARYRQPLLQYIRYGDVPFAIEDMYAPDSIAADFVVVENLTEARDAGASFLVYDDGLVADLREFR